MGWNRIRSNKYGASKCSYDGIVFDSRYERDRYLLLLDRQKKGEIEGLRRQVAFVLVPKVTHMVPQQLKTKVKYVERVVEKEADYHCDFLYKEGDKYVVEEFKSKMTATLTDYILRRKLMVRKIYEHNAKGRSRWVFREVVYSGKSVTVKDK